MPELSFRELEAIRSKEKLTSAMIARPSWPVSGFVPFSEEAYWIATREDSVEINLQDAEQWKPAYEELRSRIVSEKADVIGRRGGNGIPEKIPSHVFSGIQFCYPFEDPTQVLLNGQAVYVVCSFTNESVEGEYWQNGMSDQIFGPGFELHWSQLQIRSFRPGNKKRASNKAKSECLKWLIDEMCANKERPMSQRKLFDQVVSDKWPSLTLRGFKKAWKEAGVVVTESDWNKPGAPRK
jgi:hypothetical protein